MSAKDQFRKSVEIGDTIVYVSSGRSASFTRAKITKIHPKGGVDAEELHPEEYDWSCKRFNVTRFIKYTEPT